MVNQWMWRQFKLSAYFRKKHIPTPLSCKSGLRSNSFDPHMLQLKQGFWPISLPSSSHLEEMLTSTRGREKKEWGTLASFCTAHPSKVLTVRESQWQPLSHLKGHQSSQLFSYPRSCTDLRPESPLWGKKKINQPKTHTKKGEVTRSTWMTKTTAVESFICTADSSAGKQ